MSQPFEKVYQNQEAIYNLRLGFSLSSRPHLHRANLVTVQFDLILAVQGDP